MNRPILFISYSHDSAQHREKVLSFSERLRRDGYETRLDQYVQGTPKKGWPRWMLDRLDEATFVLVVCTETYYRRFRGHEEPGRGAGVDWEGALITLEAYTTRCESLRFVPILFDNKDKKFIPEPLRGETIYALDSEQNYEALCAYLAGVAGVEPHPVGVWTVRNRRRGRPLTFGAANAAYDSHPGKRWRWLLFLPFLVIVTLVMFSIFPPGDDDTLLLQLPVARVSATAHVQATVKRGRMTKPLTVTLSSSDPSRVTVPPQVIIDSGKASATFTIEGIKPGDDDVTIKAVAEGHTAGYEKVKVVKNLPFVDLVCQLVNAGERWKEDVAENHVAVRVRWQAKEIKVGEINEYYLVNAEFDDELPTNCDPKVRHKIHQAYLYPEDWQSISGQHEFMGTIRAIEPEFSIDGGWWVELRNVVFVD